MDFISAVKNLSLVVEREVSLKPYTTWKIGGKAKYFAFAKSFQDVSSLLRLANQHKVEVFVIGGGSNILVSDQGFDGLVVKTEIDYIKQESQIVWAGSGVAMSRLATFCMRNNLQGLEWAIGIPGTVGGAIFGNSNCFGGSTGVAVHQVRLIDREGVSRVENKKYFNFSYDYSKIQDTGETVLEAAFKLSPVDGETMKLIRDKLMKTAVERYMRQPIGQQTAGSTFKALVQTPEVMAKLERVYPNWRNGLRDNFISAGFIIDQCLHLKGFILDKMQISEKHANFFVNLGDASAANCKQLIDFVKKECKNKLGITLEEEIKYLGPI